MAAGKRLTLKLKYSTRSSLSASFKTRSDTMVEAKMDMAADTMLHSPTYNNTSEQTSSPLPLDSLRLLSSSQSNMPMVAAPLGTTRRRRLSKGTTGAVIKRSASTPNVRGLAASEAAMSLADKRRSKLGYHRTSVACGRQPREDTAFDDNWPSADNNTLSPLQETEDTVFVSAR